MKSKLQHPPPPGQTLGIRLFSVPGRVDNLISKAFPGVGTDLYLDVVKKIELEMLGFNCFFRAPKSLIAMNTSFDEME